MLKFKNIVFTALIVTLLFSVFIILKPAEIYSQELSNNGDAVELVGYAVGSNVSTHTISGYVTDKDTGDPIKDAKVILNEYNETKTDSKGYFKFASVLEKTHEIHIEKDGYKDYNNSVIIDGNDLQLEVSLGYFTISGYVKDKEIDEPIENAKVKLNDHIKSSMETETNSKGYFEFKYVSQGSHTVIAEKDGYSNYEKKVSVDNDDVKLSLDLKTQADPCSISGYVRDEKTNEPINNVVISLNGSPNWVNETDDKGYFNFKAVSEGTYAMKLEKEGYDVYIKSLNVIGEDTELNIKLKPSINVQINNTIIRFDSSTGYPFIDENNRTLVPLRKVLESFGGKVEWDNDKKLVYVTKNNNTIYIPTNENHIIVNDKKVSIDTKAVIKDERTYCPIRSIIEGLGGVVTWDEETRSIVIKQAGI